MSERVEREELAEFLRDNVIAAGGGRSFKAADAILARFRLVPRETEGLPNHCQECGAWGTNEVHLRGCSRREAPAEPAGLDHYTNPDDPFWQTRRDPTDPRQRAEYLAASRAEAAMGGWGPAGLPDYFAPKPMPQGWAPAEHAECPQPCEHLSQHDAREGRTCPEHPCTCPPAEPAVVEVTDELVERAARAWSSGSSTPNNWENMTARLQGITKDRMRAALEAALNGGDK